MENRGQIVDSRGRLRPDILFRSESGGVELYLSATFISYVFTRYDGDIGHLHHEIEQHGEEHATPVTAHHYRMDVELVGARSDVTVLRREQAREYANFYLAHCPDGLTRVPAYGKLVYRDVYPRIDMVLTGTERGMKCDFVVHPGGRVGDIRLRYAAAGEVRISDEGRLIATTPLGRVEEDAPVSFLLADERTEERGPEVPTRYRVEGHDVTFEVGPYDGTKTLVIDPARQWATFYGGSNTENLSGGDPSEVDRSGNVLVTGYTLSNPFPTSQGAAQTTFGGGGTFGDAFLVKFDGQGNRLWATYYGGTSDEISHGVATDVDRNVFIAGHTNTGFPTSNAFQSTPGGGGRDAFVVKFDSTGARLWATYFGGSQSDDGYGFAVDSSGNVAVLLSSQSTGLGTTGTFQSTKSGGKDALLAKFSSGGNRMWATYYGGSNDDEGYSVASDTNDNIFISGWTNSTNFPVSGGAAQGALGGSYDAFVVKFNSLGARQWGTYFGGTGRENQDPNNVGFSGIATDGQGNVCIAGPTTGGLPTTAGAAQGTYGGGARDGYAAKFSSAGALQWATYCGGGGDDVATGTASNTIGGVLVTGFTHSTGFPVTTTASQWPYGGSGDAFIMKFDSSGARQWSTYYGGNGTDEGKGISFDPFGSIMVAGHTSNNNFPVVNAYQRNNAGQFDAFMVLFCDMERPTIDSLGPASFCEGDSVVLTVPVGYAHYKWYIDNVESQVDTLPEIVVKRAGTYSVKVWNAGGCFDYSDTVTTRVLPRPRLQVPGPRALCTGDTTLLDAGPGYTSYLWTTGETSRSIRVWTAGNYGVRVTNAFGCADSAIMTITSNPRPTVDIAPKTSPRTLCDGDTLVLTATASSDATAIVWSDGTRSDRLQVTAGGTYLARVLNQFGCVATSDSVVVAMRPRPNVSLNPGGRIILCRGDSVVINATPGLGRYRWTTGDTLARVVFRTTGTYGLTVTNADGCRSAASVDVLVVDRPTPKLAWEGSLRLCQGDSVILDAGEGFASYVWSNGEVGRRVVIREAGSYSVTVAASSSCEGRSDTVTVQSYQLPTAGLTGPLTVCPNGSSLYSATFAPNAAYDWSVTGGAGTIVAGGNGSDSLRVQWAATGGGTILLRVRDTLTGCFSEKTIDVVIGPEVVPDITPSMAPSICVEDSVELDAGAGYQSYLWSTGARTRSIVVRTPGFYTVEVVDDRGCLGRSLPFEVKGKTPPVPAITLPAAEICEGDSVQLDAGDYVAFAWSTGETSRRIFAKSAGTYSVTVTDTAGCRGVSAPVAITVHPLPTPSIEGPRTVCLNAVADYAVSAIVPENRYTWRVSPGGQIVSGQGTGRIVVQWGGAGAERVEVSEVSAVTSCAGSAIPFDVTVSTSLKPAITAVGGSLRICEGDSLTLAADPGYAEYLWSNGTRSRTIRVGASGAYTVLVADRLGCDGTSDPVSVVVVPLPRPVISPDRIDVCEGEPVTIRVDGPYAGYVWSTGERTPEITVTKSGSYSVTVTNADGCPGVSGTALVTVSPRPPVPTIRAVRDTLFSSPGDNYLWTRNGQPIPGGASDRVFAIDSGDYAVTVTTAAGCSATSLPFTIFGPALASVSFPIIEAAPGEYVAIPLTLDSSRGLRDANARDFTFRLRFNRKLLRPLMLGPHVTDLGTEYLMKISGFRPSGLDRGRLGELHFVALLGDTIATPLQIEAFRWNDTSVVVMAFNGLFRLRGICEDGGTRLLTVGDGTALKGSRPNPATGITEIEYQTIESGPTRLYVSDALGRRVAVLVDGPVSAGRYVVTLDASTIASGLYFCVLETPTERLSMPMQVVR